MSKLKNAPVIYALCQVRFSPVLRIGDHIPDIQERHRKAFPRFAEQQVQTIQFVPGENLPKPDFRKRWVFTDKPNRTGFVIHQDSVVFHTTQYDVFESFLDSFRAVLKSIDELAEVDLSERIGLRFIDFVVSRPSLALDDLVRDELKGFRMDDATQVFHQEDTICDTPAGRMRFRLTRGIHQSPLPPDLQSSLEMNVEVPSEPSIILDTDHFNEETRDFDVEEICRLIDDLHRHTGTAFRAAVTKEALKAWQ